MKDLVSLLEWDTAHFGFPIAQIEKVTISKAEIDKILQYCKEVQVKLLQFKCDVHHRNSVLLAESNNFHFADLRMILRKDLTQSLNISPLPDKILFREADIRDAELLMEIVENLYVHSRYYFDANFPRAKVNDLYREWVRKAITGEFDDLAWVVCTEDEPVAFCTVRFNGHEAIIGLVGVHPEHNGLGMGKLVLENALFNLKKKGIKQVKVGTQGRNYPAIRLYQRVGFILQNSQIYYHRWFDCTV